MQESSPASSVTASSGGCAAAPQRHWSRHVGGADGIELQELRSRRRELAVLVEGARQENALLRIQVDRSTAALDAGGDESQLSQTLKKHTDNVRRMHEQLRHIKTRERSTERQLKKKVSLCEYLFLSCLVLTTALMLVRGRGSRCQNSCRHVLWLFATWVFWLMEDAIYYENMYLSVCLSRSCVIHKRFTIFAHESC